MGLNLDGKKTVVADFSAELAKAQAVVVAEYRGLAVGDITRLRSEARKAGVYLRVVRNTLARRAIGGTPFEGLDQHLAGPLMYAVSTDPVAVAKVLHEFSRTNDKLVLKAGAMANQVVDAAGVKALATLPSRAELLAMLLGTMQAPIAKFVRTLNEVPGRFVRTLAAVRDAKAA